MRRTALVVAGTLAAVGGLHVVWAFSSWPLADRAGFADAVVGVAERDLPSQALILLVAALLVIAAGLVAGCGGGRSGRWVRRAFQWGTCAVAAVLLLRALGGFVGSTVLDEGTETYRQLDLAVYSPLCLLLAIGATAVAVGQYRPRTHRRHGQSVPSLDD